MANQNTPQPINRNLRNFSQTNANCSYIPNKKITMKHHPVDVVSTTFATNVARKGWRRFGKDYIYPACADCNECKSVRIKVSDYKYSKSERKVINRNEETKIVIKEPKATQEHIDLYNKYHQYKSKKNGWKHQDINRATYYETYVSGAFDFGKELRYYIDDKLVCIDLIDILEDSISAVYCYYDPEYLKFSLGTYSLLYEVNLAESLGLDWVYLGYWIKNYADFKYKEKFQPLEILEEYPSLVQKAQWKPWKEDEENS